MPKLVFCNSVYIKGVGFTLSPAPSTPLLILWLVRLDETLVTFYYWGGLRGWLKSVFWKVLKPVSVYNQLVTWI